MPLDSAIAKSEIWMVRCASLIDGISFSTSVRNRIAVSLYHLCIEHHTGLHLLVDNGVNSSAFALFRPQFEAFVRGAWYHRCASENQISKFVQGQEPPSIKIQIDQLETIEGFSGGFLRQIRDNLWRNLSDFTHGGTIQVKARNTRDEVKQNYKPDHVASLIRTSATLSLLAAIGIATVAENNILINKIYEECDSSFHGT